MANLCMPERFCETTDLTRVVHVEAVFLTFEAMYTERVSARNRHLTHCRHLLITVVVAFITSGLTVQLLAAQQWINTSHPTRTWSDHQLAKDNGRTISGLGRSVNSSQVCFFIVCIIRYKL